MKMPPKSIWLAKYPNGYVGFHAYSREEIGWSKEKNLLRTKSGAKVVFLEYRLTNKFKMV